MFSPQSIQMDQLNKDPFQVDSSDINEEEINASLSNDNIAYGVEEININRSNTASSESNIS